MTTMTDDNDEAFLNYYVINDGLRWSSPTCLNNFFLWRVLFSIEEEAIFFYQTLPVSYIYRHIGELGYFQTTICFKPTRGRRIIFPFFPFFFPFPIVNGFHPTFWSSLVFIMTDDISS
jgi:hypothetical protein